MKPNGIGSATENLLDSMTRAEAERTAAALLREIAKESFRRHRNFVTATREAAQLTHLAIKLERFADDD
jgi:hypothetical protein